MNLAQLSIRYRPIVLSVVAAMTVWGALAFMSMPRREDPAFTIRTCVVTTVWPGAPAIKVEELVTDKLEEVIDGLEEVKEINSTTINGLSTIYVDLEDNIRVSDIQNVWDKVRAQVELVPMPAPNIRPVVNDTFGDTSVLVLALYQKPPEGQQQVDPLNRYNLRDLEDFADILKDNIRLLDGVAKVEKQGIQQEAIYIETDLTAWAKTDLDVGTLRDLVSSRNIVAAGGNIDTDEGKFNIKPGGEFDEVREIQSIIVNATEREGNPLPVQLSDLGLKVRRGFESPPSKYCRYSDPGGSYPAVILNVTMKAGSNIVDVCEGCMARYEELHKIEQALPGDLGVTPVSMQSDNVNQKIFDVVSNVISAVVIVVIVVWLFVGARTAIVMASNIPIVVLASLAIVSQLGVELEQISLASIIIALGLLVDNAVQICDQTRVNISEGMSPTRAATTAGKTLMFPMLVGTLTTVAAFLPMLFALEGGGKEYIYSLPVTLSTTLILSWFLAMSVCVILAAAIIRPPADPDAPSGPLMWVGRWGKQMWEKLGKSKTAAANGIESEHENADHENAEHENAEHENAEHENAEQEQPEQQEGENFFLRLYGLAALAFIQLKWVVLVGTVGLVFGATQLKIATEFFPQDRRDQFFIDVYLPETSTIEQTNDVVKKLESMILKLSPVTGPDGKKVERLRAMRSLTGGGGSRWALGVSPPSPASNVAQLLIRTTDGQLTDGFIKDIRRVSFEGDKDLAIQPIAGARIVPKALALGPPAEPVVFRVGGQGFADIEELRRIARRVYEIVREDPRVWDVNNTWGIDGYEIELDIDDQKANLSGVTNLTVADSLASFFDGAELTKFREGDKEIPVYFRISEKDLGTVNSLNNAFVDGYDHKIPLNSIAELNARFQPAKIERRDLNRTIEVKAEVEDGVSGNDVVVEILNTPKMQQLLKELPNGFSIELGGSYEESQDSVEEMIKSFTISMVAIVLILVVQYNGWSKTILILSTLPLAVVGAFLGLWLTDNPLGFMPQLGLLSLFGIVLNTGVIFIEFADMLMVEKVKQGPGDGPHGGLTRQEFRQCLADAGKQRMLPIFLTTATTVGGLIPLALSGGPLWEGLAWLMIFGLCVATLMTLLVLPALYAIVVETFGVAPIAVQDSSDENDAAE